jgi:hypothetical protein
MAHARVHPSARLACAGILALLACGCETLRTGSDYDHTATFTGLHSFTLMRRQHDQIRNPLVAQRTEDAIKADLLTRGYAYVEDPAKADFVVDFTLGSRERTDITTYPSPWGSGWSGAGWWGGPYWGNTIDVRQYTEGTLSIDIFDSQSHRPVWHGWAKKTLSQDDVDYSELNRAVSAVLEKFPPR